MQCCRLQIWSERYSIAAIIRSDFDHHVLNVTRAPQDVNFELIKVEGKVGGKLEDTMLVKVRHCVQCFCITAPVMDAVYMYVT